MSEAGKRSLAIIDSIRTPQSFITSSDIIGIMSDGRKSDQIQMYRIQEIQMHVMMNDDPGERIK